MKEFTLRLLGTGSVEIPAHGIGDAEARTEKEIGLALAGADVQVVEIGRVDSEQRIVETFRVGYRIRLTVVERAESEASALRAALQGVRKALDGTRYSRVAWSTANEPRGRA